MEVKPLSLKEINQKLGGQIRLPADWPKKPAEILIDGLNSPAKAGPQELALCFTDKAVAEASRSEAAAILAYAQCPPLDKPMILLANPRLALIKLLEYFKPGQLPPPGIHPTAVLAKTAQVSPQASIGANSVIEDGAVIEDEAIIYPLVYVGKNVRVGGKSVIHPQVSLYEETVIGREVIIHSGTVIGADGYGYVTEGKNQEKIPQVGRVVIGDRVEIGTNTSIDRATLGETVIGEGTKIDNLVHIAHNVTIGKNCLITGQVGLAGSSKIGDNVIMAARAGTTDHAIVGDGAILTAGTGVGREVKPGEIVGGWPARPFREEQKSRALFNRLPELFDRIKDLEKRLLSH